MGVLDPKVIDTNAALRTNVSAGVGAGIENLLAGVYAGKDSECGCN
ncbi:hypothetical protein [Aliikangiella sp. IMCC44359]